MSNSFELDAELVHYAWDHSIDPRLTIDPGDTVIFHTRDAGDGYYTQDSTAEDAANKGPFTGHPLTGPVYVRGAAPGDILAVEVVSMELASPFGWTAIRPTNSEQPDSPSTSIDSIGRSGYASRSFETTRRTFTGGDSSPYRIKLWGRPASRSRTASLRLSEEPEPSSS